MRGCLSVLFLGAAFLVGIVWFGGPPLAETVVQASLTSSGFEADDLDVSVSAEPPLLLALGRADRVAIEGRNVRWKDLRAESLSLTLGGVDLVSRTAVSATGVLDNIEFQVGNGEPAVASVTFEGPADSADAAVVVDPATVERLAFAAFEREFGTRPAGITLVGPDIVRVTTAAGSLDGRLEIDGGALAIRSSLGAVRLMEPNPSTPITLTGVEITNRGLELTGKIDLESLLG